jgi:hypothetical protein
VHSIPDRLVWFNRLAYLHIALLITLFTVPITARAKTSEPVAQTSALQFVPVTICRVVDTRNGPGDFGGPELAAMSTRTFNIPQGSCGIPSTAVAYSLNATVVPNAVFNWLTIWPAGEPQPDVSTLNSDGRVKASAAIIGAGTNGGVSVYASDATQLILDINGYFIPAGTSSLSLQFFPVTSCRVADTRAASGSVGGPTLTGGTTRDFSIQSGSCGIPATAKAYSINITAAPKTMLGWLNAWPSGQTQPMVSTLNAPTGAITANAAIVAAGNGGDVSIFVTDTSDVIIDVNGYFAAPTTGGLSFYTTTECRAIDTRDQYPVDGTQSLPVQDSPCAPPASAEAYLLNVTAIPNGQGPLYYLTLWADGTTQPYVSTLNALDGAITSNMAIVANTMGNTNAFSYGSTRLIVDLYGYFAP